MTATAARRDGDAPFTLAHTFAAPRARVWRAWTDPAELKQWFGPAGYTLPTCRMDLRPGGTFHYCMRSPDGKDMWGKWTFREIAAPERLAIVTSFSDAQGGITRHPMAPTGPQETLAVTTFTEEVGKTRMDMRCSVLGGTAEEHQTFDAAHAGMRQGWAGTIAQLEAYLARG